MVNDIWQMLSLGSVPVRPTTDRLAACRTIVLQSLSSQSKAESLSKSLEWDSIFFRKSQGAPGQAVASASCRCGAPHGRDGQAVASASCRCGVPHGRDGQAVASASCRCGAPHGRDGQGSGIGILPMWRAPRARRPRQWHRHLADVAGPTGETARQWHRHLADVAGPTGETAKAVASASCRCGAPHGRDARATSKFVTS